MTSTMDFALGLLQRVSASTKAAQEAERRKQREAAAARAQAAQMEQEKEKQRIREEADRMVDRNTRTKKKLAAKRRATLSKKEKKPMTPEQIAFKLRGVNPKDESLRRPKLRKPSGPPKPLPGMEFVAKKNQKKEIKVPHTSDYSDMFGDKYLVGIDVKCVQDMKEESAKATKEAQKIIAERKARAEKLLKEAEEMRKKSEEAERLGIKFDKNEWRKKAAERDYISIDKPLNLMTATEKERLLRQAEKKVASLAAASSSAPGPSGVAKGRISKNEAKIASAKEVAKRKAALKDRILAATGGAKPKPRPVRSPSPERRPSATGVRKRLLDDRDSYKTDRREPIRRPSPKRSKYGGSDRGYNSEEWSDGEDGSESDDSEDLYGIDALDREEERSRRWAALEDKRERMRELKHKKDKERRRKEYERYSH